MSGKLVKYNKYKHKKSTWLTNGLLKSIRFRDKLYKQMKCILPTSVEYEIIRLNLKTYNNILRKSLFRAKRLFLSYTFNKYKSDIKNTWKSINELLSRNYTNKSFPQSLVIDGTQISDKREIVNTFNSFFTNIRVDLANKIAYSGNKTFRDYLTDNESDNFSFTNVDEHTVINIINSLPTKNSIGYDTISTKLLKEIALRISKPLTILTNEVLTTGIFPDNLKLAKIVPILKKGDSLNINNYRPIYLLPSISKVIDKIIANQLSSYFENMKLFSTVNTVSDLVILLNMPQ